jgi:hypothetical protein
MKDGLTDAIAIVIVAFSFIATLAAIALDVFWPKAKREPVPRSLDVLIYEAEDLTDVTVAEALLTELRSQLERRTQAIQNLDSKIGQFLTIVGGGAGAIALFSKGAASPGPGPQVLLGSAGVALVLLLVNCVVSLVPRDRQNADVRAIGLYNQLAFLIDPLNKARMYYDLVRRYTNSAAYAKELLGRKRWYLVVASSLFVLAVAAVLLNAANTAGWLGPSTSSG